MSHLIAGPEMLAVLSRAKELTEIRDGTGNVVGFFAPAASATASQCTRIPGASVWMS